jgi:hypothetical protein
MRVHIGRECPFLIIKASAFLLEYRHNLWEAGRDHAIEWSRAAAVPAGYQ